MLDLEIAIIEQATITCHEDDIQHVMRWSRERDFYITNVSAEAFIKSEANVYVVTAQRPFYVSGALSKDKEAKRDLFSGLSVASREMDALPASANLRMFERSATIIEAGVRRVKLTRDDRRALLKMADQHDDEYSAGGPSILSKSAWEQLRDHPGEKTDKYVDYTLE